MEVDPLLSIEGGRSCLYQWDVDQRLEVMNDNVVTVQFDNAVTSPALVCDVYEENGMRYANVPNILLQQPWAIRAFGCCSSRVRDVITCRVIRRERPEDYVYTETEVRRFKDLERRISALEEGGTDGAGGDGIFYFDAVLSEDLATLTTETTLDVITAEISEGKLPICRAEFMGGKLHMPIVTYMEGTLAMFGVSLADTALSVSVSADGDASVSVMRIAHTDNMDEMLRAHDVITQEMLTTQLKEYIKTEDLDTAIDTALAQAKESGEFDGPQGDTGAQGPQGEKGDTGAQGPAGYTPVKGTDYYTAADKAEMVDAVIAALPAWEGGSY